jgi:transposase
MMDINSRESGYLAKIIMLKDEGYTVPQIRRAINHHDSNIRKWIHKFNEKGLMVALILNTISKKRESKN